MSPYLMTGLAAALVGAAIAGGGVHKLDGVSLAHEQADHARDNATHAAAIAQINADSAKSLSAALAKQQATEGQVASIEKQFTDEVSKHAKDSLDYRAQLVAGTQRLRVRVTAAACNPSAASGESAAPTNGADGPATFADLYGPTASGVFKVAEDDQNEIDKLANLQLYVKTLQDQGYIGQ
ncbi:lysis system i-spanin subunit Rz [Caballeronia sp. dw_276]|uniref:lysis system i-spanin subunit Rz n=1 Tax=Caballeronia sp. dw_276 TaxID=2719795 RepID=UPI001BD65799|nr:lysis system i-spanin subunit Rz [Caballeronia sp. dw_276]